MVVTSLHHNVTLNRFNEIGKWSSSECKINFCLSFDVVILQFSLDLILVPYEQMALKTDVLKLFLKITKNVKY